MDRRYHHFGSTETRLIEELAELVQVVTKAQRFGWFNHHPDRPCSETNWKQAKKEMADIRRIWKELKAKLAFYA